MSDADVKAIAVALKTGAGYHARVEAERALVRLEVSLEARKFERTQREFLAADLKALAERKPATTELGKAVEARIAAELAEAKEP